MKSLPWRFGFIGRRRYRSILVKVTGPEKNWSGRRGPMRIKIWQSEKPTLDGATLEFSGRIFKQTVTGHATTVQEAIDRLELVYRERTLIEDRRKRANADSGDRLRRREPGNARNRSKRSNPKSKAPRSRRTPAPRRNSKSGGVKP